jgi:hypothetical protein
MLLIIFEHCCRLVVIKESDPSCRGGMRVVIETGD